MTRREVIQSLGLVSAHAMFPAVLSAFLSSCADNDRGNYKPAFFSAEEFKAIPGIIDVIIPATTTKSASQAGTHVFIDQVFSQCMTKEQQDMIKEGLKEMMPTFHDTGDKLAYLTELDKKAYNGDEKSAWFKTIKQYTMIGFFTSQEGETKASNYVKVPTGYKGEIPLENNTLNYGKTFLQY